MFRLIPMIALFAALFASTAAVAEVLTCEAFKTRLAQALAAEGEPNAHPTFASTSEHGPGFLRYAWSDPSGLSGKLTCAGDDAFADFFMAVDPKSRPSSAVPSDLTRFGAFAAASVCALSDGSAEACRTMVSTMIDDGTGGYDNDLAKKDERPQNLQDYDFAPDLDAALYVTPTALSWAVGPGIYTNVDAARSPLEPKDRDTEDVDD